MFKKDLLVIPAHHRLVVDQNGETVGVFVNHQPSSLTFCLSKSAEIQHYMQGLAQSQARIDMKMAQLRRNGATEFYVINEPGTLPFLGVDISPHRMDARG